MSGRAAVISLEQDGFRGQIHAVGHSSGASGLPMLFLNGMNWGLACLLL